MDQSRVLDGQKMLAIVASVLIMLNSFTISAQVQAPNYADCMKNPFASGCRGISAKRSQSPAIQRAPSMDNLAETHFVSAFRWPQPRARFNLADLLFRPIEMQPPPFVGSRRLDAQSPFNLEFYQLFGDPRSTFAEVNNNNGRQPVNE